MSAKVLKFLKLKTNENVLNLTQLVTSSAIKKTCIHLLVTVHKIDAWTYIGDGGSWQMFIHGKPFLRNATRAVGHARDHL